MPKLETIRARVVWFNEQDHPSVEPETISAPPEPGPFEIRWTLDPSTVTEFRILGLDPAQFEPTHSPQKNRKGKGQYVKEFATTFANSEPCPDGGWRYFVEGKHRVTGKTARHDPRIENGGGPV